MAVYHLVAMGMTQKELRDFVAAKLPQPKEIYRIAQTAGVPLRCEHNGACETTLEALCEAYRTIPTEDSSLTIVEARFGADCIQKAFGDCERVKMPLLMVVHELLKRELQVGGHRTEVVVR